MTKAPVHGRIKGEHWAVLAAASAGRLAVNKHGSVVMLRPGHRLRKVTHAAQALRDRGLLDAWQPLEAVVLTELGRAWLDSKHPDGHPDFRHLEDQ